MIPDQAFDLTQLEFENQPNLTYRADLSSNRISGMIDGHDAVTQAVTKILRTERYSSVTYSSQYGVELERLIGQDYNFILSDLRRTLSEALLVDDRVLSISSFSIRELSNDSLEATFIVETVDGNVGVSTEVTIA